MRLAPHLEARPLVAARVARALRAGGVREGSRVLKRFTERELGAHRRGQRERVRRLVIVSHARAP